MFLWKVNSMCFMSNKYFCFSEGFNLQLLGCQGNKTTKQNTKHCKNRLYSMCHLKAENLCAPHIYSLMLYIENQIKGLSRTLQIWKKRKKKKLLSFNERQLKCVCKLSYLLPCINFG